MSDDKTVIEKESGFQKVFTVHTGNDYTFQYKIHGQDKWVTVVPIQGISFSVTRDLSKGTETAAGSIIMSIMDSIHKFHDLLVDKTSMDVRLRSITEVGEGLRYDIPNIRMTNFGCGVSIDDTSLEIQYTYVADSVKLTNAESK